LERIFGSRGLSARSACIDNKYRTSADSPLGQKDAQDAPSLIFRQLLTVVAADFSYSQPPPKAL